VKWFTFAGVHAVDRRGSTGRTCTVVPKVREAVLEALADSEFHIREANSHRI
jgi:hypothetical protein